MAYYASPPQPNGHGHPAGHGHDRMARPPPPPPSASSSSRVYQPDSLHLSSARCLARHYPSFHDELRHAPVPAPLLFDICHQMLLERVPSKQLAGALTDLDAFFLPFLKLPFLRTGLLTMVQRLVDDGVDLPWQLADAMATHLARRLPDGQSPGNVVHVTTEVATALRLASFLVDAGWFGAGQHILSLTHAKLESADLPLSACPQLDRLFQQCTLQLLHALNANSQFEQARALFDCVVSGHLQISCPQLLPSLYSEFSSLCFLQSQYPDALSWSLEAVKRLRDDHRPKVIIDVLRQACKASVVRRQFHRAELLIQEAVLMAKEVYGEQHPKLADTLIDYGFFLLNVDKVEHSLRVYKSALTIRLQCLGQKNLLVAMAREDLAYVTYVHQYNLGRFTKALDEAEQSLSIMVQLLPENHLLLSSSKRVLALILEEIALDDTDKTNRAVLLDRSESLHLSALALSISTFGEENVQTSKHYGNLGRLYQSMEQFDKAESMHLKAIHIKESIMGKDDYEVALSLGHLASLYNYDLNEYRKAENLYLRSVDIGARLFGPAYSGLEYDYRGLIHSYQQQHRLDMVTVYQNKMRNWRELRRRRRNDAPSVFPDDDSGDDAEMASMLTDRPPITNLISAIFEQKDSAEKQEAKSN